MTTKTKLIVVYEINRPASSHPREQPELLRELQSGPLVTGLDAINAQLSAESKDYKLWIVRSYLES